MRVGPLDNLAVHLKHKTQHAVRRRVLRPEIHRIRLDLRFGTDIQRIVLRAAEIIAYLLSSARDASHAAASRLFHRRAAGYRSSLPTARIIEIAEILRQFHRLIDHALLFFVIAKLDITGQREIFTLRMSLKTVIRQDAAQVRVPLNKMPYMSHTSRSNQSGGTENTAVALGTSVSSVDNFTRTR
jgi:hypothetical protein